MDSTVNDNAHSKSTPIDTNPNDDSGQTDLFVNASAIPDEQAIDSPLTSDTDASFDGDNVSNRDNSRDNTRDNTRDSTGDYTGDNTRDAKNDSNGDNGADERDRLTRFVDFVKMVYVRYPRLSKTLIASLVVHAIIIFYVPPEWIEIVIGAPGQAKQTRSIPVVLKGDMTKMAQNEQKGDKAGKQPGDFSGSVDGKWNDLVKRLEANENLSQSFPQKYEDLLSDSRVSDAYVHRDRHNEDIVVKEVFPTIYEIDKPFKEILSAAPKKLDDYLERNEVIQQYRDWRLGKPDQAIKLTLSDKKGKTRKGPLVFPKSERVKYFDDSLPQSKESQLSNFIRQYFSYDPDKGDLPVATRELYYDNLQRLAYPFSSDPTYFYLDYYLENLNKEDFLQNSIYQASRLDATKTQTELLFALQDIYHIQQRAWNYYFNFESLYKNLPAERKNRLRTETLHRVDERYQKVLEQKQIKNYKQIRELYSKKRLEIMDYILEKSPDQYRVKDARFERAAIEWELGVENHEAEHVQNAIAEWLNLLQEEAQNPNAGKTDADFLNRPALIRLAPVLQQYQSASNDLEKRSLELRIDQVLNFRFQERLQAKRQREEKLLWPKTEAENTRAER